MQMDAYTTAGHASHTATITQTYLSFGNQIHINTPPAHN